MITLVLKVHGGGLTTISGVHTENESGKTVHC